MKLCIYLPILMEITSLAHYVTAVDNCLSYALMLAGISPSKAAKYSQAAFELNVPPDSLLQADDLFLRGLTVSADDRVRIANCQASYRASQTTNLSQRHLEKLCNGRGECVINLIQKSYLCKCQMGYTGNYCEAIQNKCLSNPCSPGGVCQNAFRNFTCHCKVGYRGRLCQEKWLTRNGIRSRLQQLTNDIKGTIVHSKNSLLDLVGKQSNIIRKLQSSVAKLKRSRRPKYRVLTDSLNASAAAYRCSLYGGGLAMVKNAEDQREIYNLALHYRLRSIWLGAGDQVIEGNWFWWDRSPTPYNNFLPGEPDDSKGVEDCVEMLVVTANTPGGWNDVNCNLRRPFVCQFY